MKDRILSEARKGWPGWVWVVFCLVSCAGLVQALPQASLTGNLQISTREGLVHPQVLSLLQDRHGYIWIGTVGGVSRWDGTCFRSFQLADGLSHQSVWSLFEDHRGVLYFGTMYGGVTLWDGERLTTITRHEGLPGDWVTAMAAHPHLPGRIYVGTASGHLAILEEGKVIDTVPPPSEVGSLPVQQLLQVPEGLWVNYHGSAAIIGGDGIPQLDQEPYGSLAESYLRKRLGVREAEKMLSRLPNATIRNRFYLDDHGNLITLSGGDAWMVNDDRATQLLQAQGSGRFPLQAVLRTEDLLIFGSYGAGLVVLDLASPLQMVAGDLFENAFVSAIHHDAEKTYLGTMTGELFEVHGSQWKKLIPRPDRQLDQSLSFRNMNASPDGAHLYLSGNRHFITVVDLQKGMGPDLLTGGPFPLVSESGTIRIYNGKSRTDPLLFTKEGHFLIGTLSHGLWVRKEGEWTNRKVAQGLPNNRVQSLVQLDSGKVLIGTFAGMVAMTPELDLVAWPPARELRDMAIYALLESRDGTLWVGGNRGLFCYREGTWKDFRVNDGLPADLVYGLSEDGAGDVLVATSKGLALVRIRDGGPVPISLPSLNTPALLEFGDETCLKPDSEGGVWIGSPGGVGRYQAHSKVGVQRKPRMQLEALRLFNNHQRVPKVYQAKGIPYADRHLLVRFHGIEYRQPRDLVFRYRLLGLFSDWQITYQHEIPFANLPAGDYTLEMQAGLPSGSWSEVHSKRFMVLPPFWQTAWFLALVAAVLCGLLYAFHRLRLNKSLSLERLRTRIAADLHDDIGMLLTNIALKAEMIERKPENTRHLVGLSARIQKNAREAIGAFADIIWALDARNDHVSCLVMKIRSLAEAITREAGLQFEWSGPGRVHTRGIRPRYRQNVYLICREAIHNAIKHAHATKLAVAIRVTRQQLSVSITDNGVGFRKSDSSTGTGLRNMMMRARSIGGHLEVGGLETGTGTRVHFQVTL